MLRIVAVGIVFVAVICCVSLPAFAMADLTNAGFANDGPMKIDIPAGDLAQALESLARQSGAEFVYSSEQLKGVRTRGVHGEYTQQKALAKLLEGTHLTVTVHTSGAFLIALPRTVVPSTGRNDPVVPPLRLASSDEDKTFVASPAEPPQSAGSSGHNTEDSSPRLDMVVVTAQKRAERLQDVPVPVTTVSASSLVGSNKTRLADYVDQVPGLSYHSDGSDIIGVTIRGLSTGAGTNPTVGVTIDDVPFGAATANGGGDFLPEIDPSDLARIEVLRGPQGTLYGASSLGGLIKYVTVDPSPAALSGSLQVGTSAVSHAAQPGYNASASLNVPITDTVAMRASGFTHLDPGYIDDPVLGIKGVNKATTSGAHLAALWTPSAVFSLKLSGLYQHYVVNGTDHVEFYPGLGDLQQDELAGTGGHVWSLQGYSATIRAKLGIADLVSVTGYSVRTVSGDDYVPTYGYLGATTAEAGLGIPDGTTSEALTLRSRMTKLTQELRLSVPLGSRIDWLAGVFYTHDTGNQYNHLLAAQSSTGAIEGQWEYYQWRSPYLEKAFFTDFTVRCGERFDVQIGGRQSYIDQTYDETDSGPWVPFYVGVPSPLVYPRLSSQAHAFTYLLTPRLRFSDDLMAYVRIASGYRPGGPNAGANVYGFSPTYNPDKTRNYEIGLKGDAFDHRLSFDASLYDVEWHDIQLAVANAIGYPYVTNGSGARSRGIELSAEARPVHGLLIGAWVVYNDAALTQDLPPDGAYGLAGDRLPFANRWSGNVSVNEEFPLGGSLSGFAGGNVSYVAGRLGNFTFPPPQAPPRQYYSPYATVDLDAGVKFSSWTVRLFATNLADKRVAVAGGLGEATNPDSFVMLHPRTVGLNLSNTF